MMTVIDVSHHQGQISAVQSYAAAMDRICRNRMINNLKEMRMHALGWAFPLAYIYILMPKDPIWPMERRSIPFD